MSSLPLNVACVGDSLTQSVALVAKWESYPALLAALLKANYGGYGADPPADVPPYANAPRVTNLGVGGLHVAGLPGVALPYVAGSDNQLVVMCGTNDVYNGGPPPNEGGIYPGVAPVNTAKNTFDVLKVYLAEAATAGWAVTVCTIPKSFWQDWPERDAYNDLIRTLECPIADVGRSPYIGDGGRLDNRLWYQVPGIHPMGAGNMLIAKTVFDALQGASK